MVEESTDNRSTKVQFLFRVPNFNYALVAEWYTRQTQNLFFARGCGFESHPEYQKCRYSTMVVYVISNHVMWVQIPLSAQNLLGLLEEFGCPRFPVTEKITGSNPVEIANLIAVLLKKLRLLYVISKYS